MQVILWQDQYARDWRALGLSWLEQYDLVEEEDLRILDHPRQAILDAGGVILLAVENGALLGTASLIPEAQAGVYELAKLGVWEQCRGRGVADRLMAAAFDWVKGKQGSKVTLFTNRQLKAAQALYDKWGFSEIQAPDEKFLLSDKQMEKCL